MERSETVILPCDAQNSLIYSQFSSGWVEYTDAMRMNSPPGT